MSQIVNWTPAMEDRLARLWGIYLQKDIARVMGLSACQIATKARRMELPAKPRLKKCEPTPEMWIAIAKKHADDAKVSVSELLAGRRPQQIVIARWKAWREILETNRDISVSGLARVSGFDHTTILLGLKRLQGASPAGSRACRASGRRPHVPAILTAEAA